MWCSGMGLWGWSMMIALWGGVAALIVFFVLPRAKSAPPAMALLEQRLAAGEIGPDEFEEVFELAEPGKDFALYSRATLKRAR